MFTTGIDVSRWQPTVNWNTAFQYGIRFAFIRATYARTPDPFYRRHFDGAKAAGVYAAGYHFMTVATPKEAQLEAFVKAVGDDLPSMPCALDLEMRGIKQADALWMLEGMSHALGRRPVIYTSQSWWNKHTTALAAWKEYDLWIANYTTRADPAMPRDWTKWTFWQYSDKGLVPGIAGLVDMNRFNGDVLALDRYVNGLRVKVTVTALNIRRSPGVNGAKVGTLRLGQVVQVLEQAGSMDGVGDCWVRIGHEQWSAFRYNGQMLMELVTS